MFGQYFGDNYDSTTDVFGYDDIWSGCIVTLFVLPVQTVILSYYLFFINVLAFILYGVDKRKAIRNEYRIREGVLLWMARLGGGIGSWLGIKAFRHKTKHTSFRIVVPLWILICVVAVLVFVVMKLE